MNQAAMNHATFWGKVAACSVLLGLLSGGVWGAIAAQMLPASMTSMERSSDSAQFQRIEQPLSHKAIVTLGGLSLIGLELWWFLGSKPKSRQAAILGNIQEVTITVDGGYKPNQIVVQLGKPVRLNFNRTDPNSCLEEIRFPDFHIAQELPLNQVTSIELMPDKPGQYEFYCGMNMFRGLIQVQVANESEAMPPSVTQ